MSTYAIFAPIEPSFGTNTSLFEKPHILNSLVKDFLTLTIAAGLIKLELMVKLYKYQLKIQAFRTSAAIATKRSFFFFLVLFMWSKKKDQRSRDEADLYTGFPLSLDHKIP